MKRRASLILVLLLGSLSAAALAQQGMGGGERQTKTFTELDANNDGVLDENEVSEGGFDGDFSELDADGDGEVNRSEYYQYYRQRADEF